MLNLTSNKTMTKRRREEEKNDREFQAKPNFLEVTSIA